jgi:carboxyl-terminal processing protease
MKMMKTKSFLFRLFLLTAALIPATGVFAQRDLSAAETAFDYIQMKRSVARRFWSKENASPQELNSAIGLLREILVYLDKPEMRALQETYQSLKSQRADARYELAKALMSAGRKSEMLETLDQLADEAMSSVYADWLESDADKKWFAEAREDARFKNAVARLRLLDNFGKNSALRTPFQPNISEDEKIAGLSLFWSMARNGFVYFDQIPEINWDKTYLEYLAKVRQTKSTYEYYRVLQELCALLKDSHTNIYFPKELQEEMAARPPLRTALVEGKVIVERVLSETLRREGIVPGSEIVRLDGMPVKEYAEKFVQPYQSSSTRQDLNVRTYAYALLAGAKDKLIELELKDAAGKTFVRKIPRTGYSDIVPVVEKPFDFKVLQGNVGYIALNSFDNETVVKDFAQNFDAISKTDALVIDLRANGGGNSDYGDQILSYLTDKPFQTARWRSRQFRPLLKAYGIEADWFGEDGEIVKPNGKKFYAKPVVLLIGSRTFSAAEDFAMAFDFMKRGLLIGEPTGGSTGQPFSFALPGGGRARICIKRDTYPDGKRFVGIGILPSVQASPKISDLTEGKDSVLETALRELRKQIKK